MGNKTSLYKKFDYLGLITFTFLLIDSLMYLKVGVSDWRVYARLLIGVGGLMVDGYLVFIYKEKK